jgi:hypothetical protein
MFFLLVIGGVIELGTDIPAEDEVHFDSKGTRRGGEAKL